MDHVQCLRNLPSEIALSTQVITTTVMQGWKLEIPHTIQLLVDPEHTIASQINRDVNQQLPERYQELGWEELLRLYAEFIPRRPMLVLSPEIHTTEDLTEITRLELA
ncbi:hypothetical protein PAXRUDRAFT_14214 [Paxillus rubicundulus Ve08.2h10]|uniref:Uncharacterized protein n=1 Tax=Paxillus rubicundulus Ve08.2h10 TaxID=930991 RepID=A0A0D0D8J8_9AGAM|nr:hypothetical protein PAXRUDRAFT_20900 [Paxillus rubicundulus Ve08.2h10]KIK90675.1 hypothetical protein PAXRUDRAFT_14214 [Paxillus rubicundulus Ve08.2h10]